MIKQFIKLRTTNVTEIHNINPMMSMKKVLYTTLLLLVIISFNFCKKSDNSGAKPFIPPTTNGYRISSTFYNTENAGIAFLHDTSYLVFYSSTVYFDKNEQRWKGTGNYIEFDELLSNNAVDGYPIGNFTFQEIAQKGHFTDGFSITGYNYIKDSGTQRDCVRGNISVSKTGTQFQIAYDLKNDDSTEIIGVFNGALPDITSWFDTKKSNVLRNHNYKHKFGNGKNHGKDDRDDK
jgi:hypothetical protein